MQDLGRTVLDEGLQGAEVGAHLQNALQGLLGLLLQVLGAPRVSVEFQQQSRDVLLGKGLGVIGSVAAHLSQTPGGGCPDALILIAEGLLERSDALGLDDSHGHGLIEGGDVAEGDDAGEGLALGLGDEVDDGHCSSRVADELGKIDVLLGDFSDADGSVLADEGVVVLEAVEYLGEDVVVDHYFGQVGRVAGDVGQAGTHLSLQLSVLVVYQLG